LTRTVAIIQARMTSTRLPGKVLADICGKPALARMLERVQRATTVDQIIVATTDNASDDPVVALCEGKDVAVYRGSEMDVLGRYRQAAELFRADAIVRLTADCPMIDPEIIDQIVGKFQSGHWDDVTNTSERTFPDGLDAEVFTLEALIDADANAKHIFLREHVTPYIRGSRPDLGSGDFKVGHIRYTADFSHIRWTLDTTDDLDRIRRLVGRLPEEFTWLEALSEATKTPELLGPVDAS
jgi:spore coat polysaccharide biosynthesis protein SpsF (cytidylyltransferase family)